MDRIRSQREAEAVQYALDLLPGEYPKIFSNVHFFFGDPIFAGLHTYGDLSPEVSGDQTISYRDVAHYCDPRHLYRLPKNLRHPTVILPDTFLDSYSHPIHTIIHELGHRLRSIIHHSWSVDVAVSDYAESNDNEAFSEFFATWCLPHGFDPSCDPKEMTYDLESIWLFERLSEGWLP